VVGGNSDAALRRVAAWGDGWYGFNLDGVADVRERVAALEQLCAESGRDRSQLRLSVALRSPSVGDIDTLSEVGVDELVLVEAPPDRADAGSGWVSALADQWTSANVDLSC
jgi:alkanesulfonate monooxygenase SsuD/methylene tetrahydromethanopterin reductase-like flavin-dependent oxidoreductase (luciferase family)